MRINQGHLGSYNRGGGITFHKQQDSKCRSINSVRVDSNGKSTSFEGFMSLDDSNSDGLYRLKSCSVMASFDSG